MTSARDLYRVRLAAVPLQAGTPATVLECLDAWQEERLAEVVETLLYDRQWQALSDAVVRNVSTVLADEAEQHLRS
jgi:hypothetical protein